jgi:hypothetical protein
MDQSELLRLVVEALRQSDIDYFVTGSVASIFYGEPRFTNDIDVVVDLPLAKVPMLTRAFGPPDFYFEPESARRAIRSGGQFNVIQPAAGLKIDFMIASRSPFDRARLATARTIELAPGGAARIARPEHVILKKLQYFRDGGSDKHLRDIAGILRISGSEVDRGEIERWASELGVADLWADVARRNP